MVPKLFFSILMMLSLVVAVPADESGNVTNLTAEPVHVAMFKNGVGLVVARVKLPAPDGHYRVCPLPDATLGSFWMSWPKSLALTGIKATRAETTKKIPAASIQELLEANIGRTVDVKIQDVWQRVKIVDIPKRHDEPIIQPIPRDIIPPPPPPKRGDLVLIEDAMGIRGIPRTWVQALRFDSDDPHYNLDRPMQENVLEFFAEPANPKTKSDPSIPVLITSLAKGIAWSPSYVVDISKEDKATISAKTVIVNDLIPLKDTDVELIAGYPHIQFENVNSAFSLTPLHQIIDELNRRRGRREKARIASNVMRQSVNYLGAMEPAAPSMPTTPVMGESAEDLYFYKLKGISLKKGERGYHPLFAGEIPYEHLYTWDIPDYINEEQRSYRQSQAEQRQVVWHSLKLTNTTGNPWTTAPAATMKDGRILGQDTINYTPDKASTELKITQAAAVHAEQTENEIARQRNAARFYDRSYDLVTVEGKLAVTNYKDKPIPMKITKTLSGEVQERKGEPKVTKLARGLRKVNPRSQLVWELKVDPGKDKAVELEYTYKVYVRG